MRAYYDYTYYRPRHKRYSYMTGNDVEYTYGTSGNETGRFLFWTEDCYGCEHLLCLSNVVSNCMHAAVDEKYSSYYVYDHSGERRVKLTGTNDLLDVNADYMYTASVLKEPTIYPSAYMVMSNRGYTKHYYAGAERVAARIGGGGLKVIDQEHGLSDKSGSVFQQSLRQINDRILEKNDIECIANGLSSNDKLKIDMNEVPERLQAKLRVNYSEFRHTIADAQSIHHNEPDVYFYHSDHLGSASWITDNGGLAVQHLQYLPYGERYVDQRISGYSERFTFTGKERDEETGYGYFGARYMDHELMTMWLSVDPMADKYPSISPYAYCAWNPVKLVDPDGKELSEHIDSRGYVIAHYDDNDNGVYLHKVGTTKEKIDIERCMYNNTGGAGKKIGSLGDEIDMSEFFYNKLEESTSVASSISKLSYSEKLTEYAERVNQNKEWDLKNNNNTIWGVAWNYDKRNGTETLFNCEILNNANAADVGNFHAGYTGVVSGISPYLLCKGAGAAETLKTFKNHKIIEGLYRLNSFLTIFSYRSGDRKRDYYFNTKGMRCAGW